MNEASAREVILLQAFETAQPPSPSWNDDDRAWATRLARQSSGGPGPAAFIAARARHAMQRLAPREPWVARWLGPRFWPWRRVGWLLPLALLAGLCADSIGSSQRINLLAPPLAAVLAWNALVYLLLIGHALAHLLRWPTRPGGLMRITARLLRTGYGLPGTTGARAASDGGAGVGTSTSTSVWPQLASAWLRCSAPLSAARAATLLHAAAAALALGLIGGLYLRGLMLDYRAAWESTFLDAAAVHGVLVAVLAPAVAVSGIALPDATAFEALRSAHGTGSVGASAAPWIHLYALTLMLLVVLPRTALAAWGSVRARWLAGHLPLPLTEAYFQQLARAQRGDVAQVLVVPYASAPVPQAAAALHALLAPALGDALHLTITPTLAFGAEDDDDARLTEGKGTCPAKGAGDDPAASPATALAAPSGITHVAVLFDLAATPEAEHQGRYARQLAALAPVGVPTLLLVDEAAFVQRFGAGNARIAQRREAWRALADACGTLPVHANLAAIDVVAGARAVTLALRSPVSRAPA